MSNANPTDAARLPASVGAGASPLPSRRHQVKRSLTEFGAPMRISRHHGHRRDRPQDDRQTQPNMLAYSARHSLDVPQSGAISPMVSPEHSRRPSLMLQREDDSNLVFEKPESKSRKEGKLQGERGKASQRVDGLKQSLTNLNTFSIETTKRLDDTYYGVLEKLSSLHNTVTALKDLAETSQDIYGTFEKDSRDLEHDIVRQLGAVGRFEDQQGRIESLQGRIRGGQEKIQTLSKRVDAVRERVEGWEQADKMWQERTRRRLRVIWTAVSAFTLAVVLLFVSIKTTSSGSAPSGSQPVRGRNLAVELLSSRENISNATRLAFPLQSDGRQRDGPGEAPLCSDGREDDGRLRVFDDL